MSVLRAGSLAPVRLKLRRQPNTDGLTDGLGPLAAIDALTEENRKRRSAAIERRLVALRHEAFSSLPPASPAPGPGAADDAARAALGSDSSLPVLAARDLSAATVRAGIETGGCVLIRGLLDPGQAAGLVDVTDRAMEARRARSRQNGNGRADEWFDPFRPAPEFADCVGAEWNRLAADNGTLWAVDSPRGLFEMLEVLTDAGIAPLAEDYLGGRPTLSLNKCNLRRVSPDSGTNWHQDGRFLGEGLRALNLWVALNPCGVDAPGLDIVAKRLPEIVETGTEDALFDWTVGHSLVERVAGPEGITRPVFEAGDALLFDELCLHRTAVTEEMTHNRYALEVWMFSHEQRPTNLVPIVF